MQQFINFIQNMDLNSLITIFDIQIAIALVIIAFLTKGFVARIIIGIIYKLSKNSKKAKESEMYSPLKNMYVILSIYIAFNIIPKGERITYIFNEIFNVVIIIFVTKFITTLIHSDSKYLKKIFKKRENERINDFVCKMARGIIWVISFFVIMAELDLLRELSGFMTGIGLASAIIALAAQELVKNLLSRSINSYRQAI